ncbi:hypothetical protein ROHU_002430 [Labeo rohita]|uniref:Uncharacterized protein n=1 Tax=Labeo rohita TaxID=84645 RepID=A0A498NYQ6_LABRO|nr:hypothetical protein ROHU_023966 [Labeo rohita]RXN37021.1 hypothetical protein ROHU_002430 [Labeo rohita]
MKGLEILNIGMLFGEFSGLNQVNKNPFVGILGPSKATEKRRARRKGRQSQVLWSNMGGFRDCHRNCSSDGAVRIHRRARSKPAPIQERSESTPKPESVQERSESTADPTPVCESTESTLQPTLIQPVPGRRPSELVPVYELTPEPAEFTTCIFF